MLLSLSWGLGKYSKERGKYGEKIYFLTSLCHLFHLSSHIYLLLLLFLFCLLSVSSPFFRFARCSSSYEPGMLLRHFHKELRFQPLSRRMALGGGCSGGGVWGYFKSGFLMLLSCKKPSSPSSFFPIQPSCLLLSLRATVVAGVAVGCEGGQKQLIGRQYFLVKMLQCDKAIIGREQPRFAALLPEQSCGEGSPHRANRDSCRHMFLYGRSREKRTPETVTHFEYFSEK